jgi:hypothetical protein
MSIITLRVTSFLKDTKVLIQEGLTTLLNVA